MPFQVIINPGKVELEGGPPFELRFDEKLPEEVVSAWALFGNSKRIDVIRGNENFLIGFEIPPAEKPGFVPVEVFTQDKIFLGETKILYLDNDDKKIIQKVVHSKKLQCILFQEFAHSFGSVGQNISGLPGASSFELTSQAKSAHAVDVLKRIVYTAAETNASEFLHMIFNSSAGRVVFDAVKDMSPLPEDTAKASGFDETAEFLRDIFQRFSHEERKGQEQLNEIDWAELEKAVTDDNLRSVAVSSESKVRHWLETQLNDIVNKDPLFEGSVVVSSESKVRHWLETQLNDTVNKVPRYILARGEQATAAYQRALQLGKTKDKRVKIYVIGRDRAGKTSLVRSMKGEPFREDEVSTNGVEISQNQKKGLAADYYDKTEDITSSFKVALEDRKIPHEIAKLVEVLEQDSSCTSGIYPVIWDFAGQSIYRAIHPIFMTLAAVYILVFDLSKELFAKVQCHVREDGYDDVEIPAPDSDDTNLDHMMRWLDVLQSFSEDDETLPAVFLVGTHVDAVNGDPKEKMDAVLNTIDDSADIFYTHIENTFTVDNTKACQLGKEDQIVNLWEEILSVAKKLPHMKDDIPLIWLEVEDGVYNQAAQGEKYMTRQKFKKEIADKICNFECEDDFEVFLQFLHDRGTIVYHDRADNPDGLVVLDPQWLVHMICKIITPDKQKGEKPRLLDLRQDLAKDGILRAELLDLLCNAQPLGDIQHFLLFIMKKFNLLCEWKHEGESSDYMVPCMLTRNPEGNLVNPKLKQHEPVFITFSTNYVPCGLFSRLLVFFCKWSASKTFNCDGQQLFANAATFVIGENTCAAFVCGKSVIKIYILVNDKSKPVDKDVCLELRSVLETQLDELKKGCHWLRAVTWELCGQCSCKHCPKKVNTKTGKCFRHQEKECSDDDCAHYVPVRRKPFVCNCGRHGHVFPVPNTWIQALQVDAVSQEKPDAIKEGNPSMDELEGLSMRIGNDWKRLGRRLNLTEAELTAVHKENEENYEKSYQMLLHWRQRNGKAATYLVLHNALCHDLVQRRDLAEFLFCYPH